MRARFFISVLSGLFFIQTSAVSGGIYQQISSSDDSLKIIEKVYLHVDRDSYSAGDDIWFKAYMIDAVDRLLTEHSGNLHVELISPFSEIISSRIIRLEGGKGNGDFKLPADIKSGRYKIRAYTNYMRNFSDRLFFTKEIIVINSAGPDTTPSEVKYVEKQINLSFFPEGGSLVDNVSSNVAFKVENNLGKGCKVSGKIFSSNGELITTFKTAHLGMGSFFLRPIPGLTYYSVYRGADSVDFKAQLPASFPVGVTFSVSTNQDNDLLLTAKTNPQTLADISDNELLLTISIRKEVHKIIPFKINSPVTSFIIPTYDLPDGIIMLTLSGPKDLPLAERLVYIEHETPVRIQIKPDKSTYNKREPVSLKISLPGDSATERNGNISLAVVNENLLENNSPYPRTISSWFLLESDVRGNVEDPSYYFDPANPDRLKDLDLLLRTQGWRDFQWKYNKTYFSPENGFMVSGKIRFRKNKPIEDPRVSIGIFGGKSTFLKSVPVDSTGRFKLSGINFTGQATLIATGIGSKDHPDGVMTLDSVKYNPPEVSDSPSIVTKLIENNENRYKSYYTINEAIKKKYKLSDTINLGEVNIITERHKDPQTVKVEKSRSKYVQPDAELIVTESMNSYQNIPELLRGKIAGMEVIGPRDGDYFIFFRGISTIYGSRQPLVLIDGNPVSFQDITIMPIINIDRIDILKRVSSTVGLGIQAASGVINLITKAGGVQAAYKPVNYSARLKFAGYNESRIFYSPQHLPDSKSDLNPDLRSTLYWEPDVNLKGNEEVVLNYYNGDNPSIVRINAEGITTSGIPVTGKAEYEVK